MKKILKIDNNTCIKEKMYTWLVLNQTDWHFMARFFKGSQNGSSNHKCNVIKLSETIFLQKQ